MKTLEELYDEKEIFYVISEEFDGSDYPKKIICDMMRERENELLEYILYLQNKLENINWAYISFDMWIKRNNKILNK